MITLGNCLLEGVGACVGATTVNACRICLVPGTLSLTQGFLRIVVLIAGRSERETRTS